MDTTKKILCTSHPLDKLPSFEWQLSEQEGLGQNIQVQPITLQAVTVAGIGPETLRPQLLMRFPVESV